MIYFININKMAIERDDIMQAVQELNVPIMEELSRDIENLALLEVR